MDDYADLESAECATLSEIVDTVIDKVQTLHLRCATETLPEGQAILAETAGGTVPPTFVEGNALPRGISQEFSKNPKASTRLQNRCLLYYRAYCIVPSREDLARILRTNEASTTYVDVSNFTDTNGNFFGYASLPMILFANLDVVTSFSLHGYGWNEYVWGSNNGSKEAPPMTQLFNHLDNSLLFSLFTFALLPTLQVISAMLIQVWGNKIGDVTRTDRITWIHGISGQLTYFLWIGAFAMMAVTIIEYDRHTFFLVGFTIQVLSVATLAVNLVIGIFGVTSKSHRDMFLHKGAMFFALNSILSTAMDKILTIILRLSYPRCTIWMFGSLVGETVQLSVFGAAAWCFDSKVFKSWFVLINMIVWFVRTFFLFRATLQATSLGDLNDEGCFSYEAREGS